MANKKNKKKAQQPAPANKAAANSRLRPRRPLPRRTRRLRSQEEREAWFLRPHQKYFASVKSEMKRVTWPDKKELVNYSVVVCASLIVVGVVIALLDAGFSEALALFSGLRG
ncbi:MAG: preprotein translocase subunit SecE [Collinsella sp.]